ncbi:hypothetical protein ACJ72_01826 [Emergomyces africanus]|uniref:Uncharacterized protein n=1 Tax=Emergomyces africanus TaxID=1955775 RepID=A0A1B7P453_9EURO|nr:hypothetical protein ACJ72_01826 [Emergomyces africanus]
MNSWSDSRTGGSEPHRNPPRLIVPPPAPPLTGAQVFPRRRENVAQPPSLTTSLSGVQFQGAGFPASPNYAPTPSSMNSFSSPFSPMRSSFTPSSGEMSAMTTPMSSRHVSYNAAYNPQEWGPIAANGSPSAGMSGFAPLNDTTSIPPPPYSPRHPKPEETRAEASPRLPVGVSSSPLTVSAQYNPTTPARTQEPASGYGYPASRARPVSMIYSSDITLGDNDNQQPSAPPPNASGRPSQYSVQNSVQSGQGNPQYNASAGLSNLGSSSRFLHDNGSGDEAIRPPASIRAASTGDIGQSRNGGAAHAWLNRQPGRWEPGMPLPPPPPGPPPSGVRNQSRESSRGPSQDSSNRSSRHRSPPVLGTGLGEVPPTPAGWIDEAVVSNRRLESSRERASSMSQNTNDYVPVDELARLTQYNRGPQSTIHRRDEAPSSRASSSKGIRERRIEARKDHASSTETTDPTHDTGHGSSGSAWPSDLVLGNLRGPGLTRRRTVTKNTPRTPRTAQSDGLLTASTMKSPPPMLTSAGSAQSTPKQQPTPSLETFNQPSNYAQTPPFSPGCDLQSPNFHAATTPNMPPRALPTPPLQAIQERRSSTVTSSSTEQEHTPLGQSRPSSRLSQPSRGVEYSNEEFMRDAIQRHHKFIEKEASAVTAVEALELFAEFIVSESKIRQHRHAIACERGLFDVQNVRERLFQPDTDPHNSVRASNSPSAGINTRMDPPVRFSPVAPPTRIESGWWNNYKPSLSPIGSISIRDDEMSSRGRAPSRWWESQTGSESGGSGKKIRRSKQEAKYMGVPREVREAMQQEHFSAGVIDGNQSQTHPPAFGFAAAYGPNEYPPEKVGFGERQPSVPRAPMAASHIDRQFPALDISRFITLPPPYPRHYPAVNNSHPDLLYYRSTVRSVSDLTEVQETKQAHQQKLEKLQHDHQIKMKESRRAFRSSMNTRIEEGTLSYAEAAEAEAVRLLEEQKCEKELVKAEFESYQEVVFQPLQLILTDRIDIASTSVRSSQDGTPNQTQEEGDERPELLEKLTQLKWLFEALEQLHREVYGLESERNERYRAIVTLPYRQSKNQEKLEETDSFFLQDAQNRKLTFATATLRRFESFMEVIEQNVGRGAETQLSAFWDIAPSLVTVLQKIPEDLRSFSIQIPSKEYEENPSYYQFPLQYLYSLLCHAEKSTYQYIESQTNLLCLLHEVKTSLMKANCNVMEMHRIISGEPAESVQREMTESSEEEEKRLTADLKDKVTMVEEQWAEALGKELGYVKTRVQQDLENQGGWDDTMFEQS